MPTYDDDFSPIAMADTGIPKEWDDEEVKKMFEDDYRKIKGMENARRIFVLMNKLLDQLERENAEDSGEMTSILREKILRGKGLSDAELESTVISETCRLMFGKVTVREFLRRMIIVGRLVDLDADLPEE